MNGAYCYSWDGERYFGQFDSEDDALKDAKGDRPLAESVYIGTCTEPELKWNSCEENIINSIIDNLGDDVGEAAEDFDISSEDEMRLAKLIDDTVRDWISKNNIKPSCYTVLDGHKVSLN